MSITWDLDRLGRVPRVFPAPGFSAPGVRPLFFEGEFYRGGATRVFAWMGVPHAGRLARRPGMVLLHGGGGTAFDEWVRIWNRRGYAAIAMDLCGCVPKGPSYPGVLAGHERHEHGGPPGWDASFAQTAEPPNDQWTYHAVAAAVRARALLSVQPGVDPDSIGLTGISWGGYLTCIVAGVDDRLGLAVPVYGCGFLGDNSFWRERVFPDLPPDSVGKWLELWDPSVYLPAARMPLCWMAGTNDECYPLDSLVRSVLLAPGEKTLCLRVEMPHGHEQGWHSAEIGVMADALFLGEAPLPRILEQGKTRRKLWARVEAVRPVISAEICFTRATGLWQDRRYNRLPAKVSSDGTVEADIPPRTTVAFLNIFDDRDCVSSSLPFVSEEATDPT
jgi:dienelactone hydrolase